MQKLPDPNREFGGNWQNRKARIQVDLLVLARSSNTVVVEWVIRHAEEASGIPKSRQITNTQNLYQYSIWKIAHNSLHILPPAENDAILLALEQEQS
jgi:hypothetical protein